MRIVEEVKERGRKLYIWRFIIGHEHFNKSDYDYSKEDKTGKVSSLILVI